MPRLQLGQGLRPTSSDERLSETGVSAIERCEQVSLVRIVQSEKYTLQSVPIHLQYPQLHA